MYLNVIQLAESLGVEESVIEGWVRKEGLPCVQDRGRLVFDRSEVVAWAAKRGMAAKAGFLAPAREGMGTGRRLRSLLEAGGIWRGVTNEDLPGVLSQVVSRLPGASETIRSMLVQRVKAAGGVTWSPVGGGIALPHLRSPAALGRDSGLIACVFLRDALPICEPAPDRQAVTTLLFFIAPSPRAHLEILSQLSLALTKGRLRSVLRSDTQDSAILDGIAEPEWPSPEPREAIA